MDKILLASLGGLCIFFSCVHLLPEKLSFYHQTVILMCTLILSCIFDYYLGQFFAFLTVSVLLIFIYHFTTLRWLSLSCSLFGYLFTIALNHFYIWGIQSYLHMNLEEIYLHISISILISFFYCIVCFVTTYGLGYILNYKLRIHTFLTDDNLCKVIFLTLLLLSILFIFNFSYGEYIGYSYGVTTFNGILFLLLFISVAILIWILYQNIQKKIQAENMLHKYEHLQTYTEEVEKLYNSMRSFKHEYVNLLSTLSGYIEKNDMAQLKDYFHKEILPISQAFSESDTRLGLLSHIEILELKSLLSSKLFYTMELGIHVDLELTDIIRDIPMKSVDLVRVMGIFLDNAIDAALKSNEKLIQLCFIQKGDCMIMILQNSSSPPQIPISNLADWGISSKGAQRGIGLYNAKSILNQYPHILWDMEYQAPYFTQTLTIHQTGEDHL